MALTQALSLCVTIYYHKQDESQITQKKLRSRHGFAFEEGRMSLRIGVPTRQWQFLMHVEEVIEAPATGLVGAYGMSLVPTLTSIQAASGMYGLIASALAMGRGRMGYGSPLSRSTSLRLACRSTEVLVPHCSNVCPAWLSDGFLPRS